VSSFGRRTARPEKGRTRAFRNQAAEVRDGTISIVEKEGSDPCGRHRASLEPGLAAPLPVVICSLGADELDGSKKLMRQGLREGADYVAARKPGLVALEEVISVCATAADTVHPSGERGLKLGER
jgi:hypothetical protein